MSSDRLFLVFVVVFLQTNFSFSQNASAVNQTSASASASFKEASSSAVASNRTSPTALNQTSSANCSEGPVVHCGGPIVLPDTFDVSSLATSITRLILSNCYHEGPYNPPYYSNVILANYAPLPASKLASVLLCGFNQKIGGDAIRFPINGFLQNVKSEITSLELAYVQLDYLNGSDFQGFSALKKLRIVNTNIKSIDVASFEGLKPAPGGSPGLPSGLGSFEFKHSELFDLDWSVFFPVANTLQNITINQALTGIILSRPFAMSSIRSVDLERNRLPGISRAVLETLGTSTLQGIRLSGNLFCDRSNDSYCACCEVEPLVRWASTLDPNQPAYSDSSFTCGNPKMENKVAITKVFLGNFPTNCNETRLSSATASPCIHRVPLAITCRKGVVEIPDDDLDNSDAIVVDFDGDQSLKCRNILRDIQLHLLNSKPTPMKDDPAIAKGIVVSCSKADGLTMSSLDPDTSEASRISFETAVNDRCRSLFMGFLKKIRTYAPPPATTAPPPAKKAALPVTLPVKADPPKKG